MAGSGPPTPPPKGSGGSRREGGGGESNPCERPLQTFLSNVQTRLTGEIQIGSRLDVKLIAVGGKSTLACVNSAGEFVGAILSRGAARLTDCIGEGYEYIATVITIDYGALEVMIRSRS